MHALTTLNDATWVEAARVLAESSMKHANDRDGRLVYAFRQVVGRQTNEQDLASLRSIYNEQYAIYETDAESAKALVSVGASKRDEFLNLTEHAALTAVCLAILNLDEALTRE
jgi:hypothetical protein